jgi:hypothetical protein
LIQSNLKILKKGLNFYRKFITNLSLLLSSNLPSQSKHSLKILDTRNLDLILKELKEAFEESRLKGSLSLFEFENIFRLKQKQIENYVYLIKKYDVGKMNHIRNIHNTNRRRVDHGRINHTYMDIYDYQSRSLDQMLKKI